MRGLFQHTDDLYRLVCVGLLITHTVVGLVTTTKTLPRPFTKTSTLPPLDKIPTTDDGNSPPEASRDYSLPLPVVYTNDLTSAEEWVDEYLGSSSSTNPLVLGWDMESSPYLPWLEHKYTRDSYFGPATLQLSTSESVLLVQIAEDGFGPIHDGGLPRLLHDVLENPGIIPTGVGIDDDMIELYRWCLEHGDDCAGPAWAAPSNPVLKRFDMGGIGVPLDVKSGRTIGLARLVAGILGVEIPKSKKLARTQWSKKPFLSKREVAYAARDAWAGAAIMERLGDLDPDRFGPKVLLELLETQIAQTEKPLQGIRQISNKQLVRKAAKVEWKELRNPLDADGNERPPWTDPQRERHDELVAEIQELAPAPPLRYDIIESLGLKIP